MKNKKMTAADIVELVMTFHRDDFMFIGTRLKAFRFHEAALRKEVFYDKRDALASAYRLDNNADDLFREGRRIGNMILSLNTSAKRDPYIGVPFLNRTYKICAAPDLRTSTDEEIITYYRDVYQLLDDYEALLYDARPRKEEKKDRYLEEIPLSE